MQRLRAIHQEKPKEVGCLIFVQVLGGGKPNEATRRENDKSSSGEAFDSATYQEQLSNTVKFQIRRNIEERDLLHSVEGIVSCGDLSDFITGVVFVVALHASLLKDDKHTV